MTGEVEGTDESAEAVDALFEDGIAARGMACVQMIRELKTVEDEALKKAGLSVIDRLCQSIKVHSQAQLHSIPGGRA